MMDFYNFSLVEENSDPVSKNNPSFSTHSYVYFAQICAYTWQGGHIGLMIKTVQAFERDISIKYLSEIQHI